MITTPMPTRYFPASPPAITIGSVPAIIANVVMRIGRSRTMPACMIASLRLIPERTPSIAKSTSRIEFFVTSPSSMTIPIIENMSSMFPVMNREMNAPDRAGGSAMKMVNGVIKDS